MSMRVVVADDEDLIREGMARQIESLGIGLSVAGVASDGVQALSLVEEHVPEIVLMDINMPFMDGLECIRRIRQKDPDCVIIIVSGYDRFEYAQKALQYGVDFYLLKPVEDEDFEAALRNAVRKYEGRKSRLPAWESVPERENSPERILAFIRAHYADREMTIENLESMFSMSRSALFKTVKRVTGFSTIDLITSLRIDQAKRLLLDDRSYTVKEICAAVGYGDQHYFCRLFKRHAGRSPTQYRNERVQKDTSRKH